MARAIKKVPKEPTKVETEVIPKIETPKLL
jgi:hypothetical protein